MDWGKNRRYSAFGSKVFITVYLKIKNKKGSTAIRDLCTIKKYIKKSSMFFKYSDPQIPDAVKKETQHGPFYYFFKTL